MTDFAALLMPDRGQPAHLLHAMRAGDLEAWRGTQPERVRAALAAARFDAKPGAFALIPGARADDWSAAIGLPDEASPWDLAAAAERLPDGAYRLADGGPGVATLGWLLAQHRFDRYRSEREPAAKRVLLTAEPARIEAAVQLAEAVALVRDLVDTPAADMGPAELSTAVEAAANLYGARLTVTQGDALAQDYPMIHAVGRAASRTRGPRLIELEWGDPAPVSAWRPRRARG